MRTAIAKGRKSRTPVRTLLLALLLCSRAPLLLCSTASIPAVLDEFDRLCRRPIWPGFEPCGIPLVIFDGSRTWLVRHPSPPPEFSAEGGRPQTRIFEGRHGSVRANTSVDLAGTVAASASFDHSGEPRKLAALLLHEAFHVFEGKRHPSWGANEAELFLYPVDDAAALADRRLESAALARALAADDSEEASAWAARALELRRERFALLPPGAAEYERANEVREGLARYVEKVSGDPDTPLFSEGEFPAAAIRDRAYASGAAMALLLDRLDPDWKKQIEEKDTLTLEALLADAVSGARPQDFLAGEVEKENQCAAADVATGAARRSGLRREVLEGKGWRLVIEPKEPLQAQGFDPLNVERLSATEVLHARFLKLGNSSGSVEVLGRRCLTESAGKHPLFEGVRRATIELSGQPRVEQNAGIVRISGDGVTLEYRGQLTSRGHVYIIH